MASQDPLRGPLFMCRVSSFAMGEGGRPQKIELKKLANTKVEVPILAFNFLRFVTFVPILTMGFHPECY